jgi:hypothetical protein
MPPTPDHLVAEPVPADRRRAIAELLAAGVIRLAAGARAAALSAGRSSDNLADTPPTGLAFPAETSVTVHAG